jgi:hypothetical protein
VSGQFHAPAASPPGKELPIVIGKEDEWAPGPVWTWWRREKIPSFSLPGIEPRSSSPYSSHCKSELQRLERVILILISEKESVKG